MREYEKYCKEIKRQYNNNNDMNNNMNNNTINTNNSQSTPYNNTIQSNCLCIKHCIPSEQHHFCSNIYRLHVLY